MATGNEELEEFKTQINFCEYASSQGFVLDRKLSSRASAVMRHPNGDKIIVAKRPNGHWTYFNVHGSDSGTVIDFVSARKSVSLGRVRKELRPWIGKAASIAISNNSFALIPTEGDLQKVRRRWERSRPITAKDTYLSSRKIPRSILEDPVFENRIRIDEYRNCIFPHWDSKGELSGFEIKSKSFTGFSPGGKKWFWYSQPRTSDHTIVVCESAIDALSMAALEGIDGKRFFSTAGQYGPQHIACLIDIIKQMPAVASIWLAFDNDQAGRQMAGEFRSAFQKQFGGDIAVVDRFPITEGTDWNDVLQSQSAAHANRRSNTME